MYSSMFGSSGSGDNRPHQAHEEIMDDRLMLLPEERQYHQQRPGLSDFASVSEAIRESMQMMAEHGGANAGQVWICLLRATSSRTSWSRSFKRWMIRKMAGRYNHVEVLIRMTDGTAVAYTVDQADPSKPGSGQVRKYTVDRSTVYDPQYWDTFCLSTFDPVETNGVVFFLESQLGKPMNSRSMYANFLPLSSWFVGRPNAFEEQSYFCSQLVIMALGWVRPTPYRYLVNPRRCTPELLHRILEAYKDPDQAYSSFRPVEQMGFL